MSEECLSSGGSVSIYSQVGHPAKRSWGKKASLRRKRNSLASERKWGAFGAKLRIQSDARGMRGAASYNPSTQGLRQEDSKFQASLAKNY